MEVLLYKPYMNNFDLIMALDEELKMVNQFFESLKKISYLSCACEFVQPVSKYQYWVKFFLNEKCILLEYLLCYQKQNPFCNSFLILPVILFWRHKSYYTLTFWFVLFYLIANRYECLLLCKQQKAVCFSTE